MAGVERIDAASGTQAILDETERLGLSTAILIRSGLMVLLMAFSIVSQDWPQGIFGAGFVAIFLAAGLAFRAVIRRRRDRRWMRYAFVGFDAVALSLAAINAPLSTGGDVPQILVFRVFGVDVFYFVLATSALSLSPRLVLWAGAAGISALWLAWGVITAGMERTVSWGDLPPSAPAELFMAIFLDPDFIGLGNRTVETLLLAATAAVLAAAAGRARALLVRQLAAERERSRVAEVFGRFVPAEVARSLAEGGGTLAAARREATVVFVDVEGFTAFAAARPPDRVVAVLDAFFDRVSAIAAEHRGVVISLIGDAAMIAFNAPLDNPGHARDAVGAARALLDAVAGEDFAGERLGIRIGIATGEVAAGTIGGRGRQAYTLYGDTVNHAQRLEGANKTLGSRLAVSDGVWQGAGRPGGFRPEDGVAIRGRPRAERIHVA